MIDPTLSLHIARAIAAQSGEDLDDRDKLIAAVMERLLIELEIKTAENERFREELHQWGIPAKRRTIRRLEKGGFERGWTNE